MHDQDAFEKTAPEQGWIGWAFFLDLINGLRLTAKYMFSKTVTMEYPDKEKWIPYPRFKGHHLLRKDEQGETLCVACELCAKICPCYCITVVPHEDEKGNRRPEVFDVDTARCLFCGLCEDACPVECIVMGSFYEYSVYQSDNLVAGRDKLLTMPDKMEQGGFVTAAGLDTANGVTVDRKKDSGHDWWKNIHRHD